jgi:Transposase DDE domain
MERELWLALYKVAEGCGGARWWEVVRFRDYEIVGVFLWAVVHDRPVSWACDPINWPKGLWKGKLPSQSTMSRRLRTTEVQRLLSEMEGKYATLERPGFVALVDGKPLVVGTHSKDRDAQWGRAGRGYAKGYKLHAIYGRGELPLAWDVAPLNVSEPEVAARCVSRLEGGGGYLLGDKAFDSNPLHDLASSRGYQLVAERKRPNAGLGHRRHSPSRLRSIHLLHTEFGQDLYRCRDDVERKFGWLTTHSGGLAPLPAWVRRPHRVRLWVQGKLLVHAAYVYSTSPHSPLAAA